MNIKMSINRGSNNCLLPILYRRGGVEEESLVRYIGYIGYRYRLLLVLKEKGKYSRFGSLLVLIRKFFPL